MRIEIKRVYEPARKSDGFRVLVDRLWPRGIKKDDARIDLWAKDLAPSTPLRKWFGHEPGKFGEFAKRYEKELSSKASDLQQLVSQAAGRALTLVYSARDEKANQAVVLRRVLMRLAGQAAKKKASR